MRITRRGESTEVQACGTSSSQVPTLPHSVFSNVFLTGTKSLQASFPPISHALSGGQSGWSEGQKWLADLDELSLLPPVGGTSGQTSPQIPDFSLRPASNKSSGQSPAQGWATSLAGSGFPCPMIRQVLLPSQLQGLCWQETQEKQAPIYLCRSASSG